MLALAAANVVGVVLFAGVYATAGVRLMSHSAFVACLVVMFALVTVLWVRVESRHRPLGAIRRLGRATAGLVLVLVAVPSIVLMPAFWLDTQLPPDADFTRFLGPLMSIVLIALGLIVLVNLVGAVTALVRAAAVVRARVQ